MSLAAPEPSVAAAGAVSKVSVTTDPECAWTATAEVGWIAELAPRSGQGNGELQFRVSANPDGVPREGAIAVNNQRAIVRQEAAACTFALTSSRNEFDASGGEGQIAVAAPSGCAWTISLDATWILLAPPASGTGSGTVTFRVSENQGGTREATLAIGGQRITIRQDTGPRGQNPPPGSCPVSFEPGATSVAAGGGSRTIAVSSAAGCGWPVTTGASWITITAPAGGQGSGSGTVAFQVAPNTGGARAGTLEIAGVPFTINQAGATNQVCAIAVDPINRSVGPGAVSGAVAVSAAAGCAWTAVSNVSWIAVTAGASGTGSGTVTFGVDANTAGARTGTLTIGGQVVTVSQSGGCTYSISPTTFSASAAAVSGPPVTVSAASGCAWTATSNASWLTVTSAASGTGAGATSFDVAANPGASRTGTLTIAGQTLTVAQAGACVYTISPTSYTADASGGTGSVAVASAADCAWTATSNASWLTVTSGASGSGAGSASFAVAANPGAARTGTLTIAGQSFTVAQAGACVYTISPTSYTTDASGGTGSVAVASADGCAWTAASDSAWVKVTGGASGSGNGTVTFTVDKHPSGQSRTATLTVAGQSVTVTQQAAACAYTIKPTSYSAGSSGGTGSAGVSTADGCAWTATSDASWVTITAGAAGSGNGSVTFAVASNSGPARTATLAIAGQSFTVTQEAAPCSYSIAPASQTVGGSGGPGEPVSVTTADGCAWTAASNAGWLTVTSGTSGTGKGTVTFTAAAYDGKSRTGTITIAGQTLTVIQNGCDASLSPTKQSVGGLGGLFSVSISVAQGCSWTASSNSGWITITSGSSGNGNGTVSYLVTPNLGGKRSGTITIHGETLIVEQAPEKGSD